MALKDTALNIVIRLRDLTKGALGKFKKEIDDTDKAAKKAAGGGLKRMASALGTLVGATIGLETLRRGIIAVLTTGDKFEKLGQQMEAVMGSIESGESATAWIKQFTKDTPLQLEEVTESFLKLKNFGLDPMDGTLQGIVDQNEKLGGGSERLAGITNALGQAFAKGKLQGEEMLQLIERGVPVYDLLEKVTGKTGEALSDMQQKGELTKDTIKALIAEMGEQNLGIAAKRMDSMSGIVSNLKDRFQEWLLVIANSGALDNFKQQLSDLTTRLDGLAADGTLNAWAQTASNAIVSLFNGIRTFATAIVEAKDQIAFFGKVWAGLQLAKGVDLVRGLAFSFSAGLAPGARAAAVSITAVGTALRGIIFFAVAEQLFTIGTNMLRLRDASKDLAAAQNDGLGVQGLAATKIAEFVAQTGIAVTSLEEMSAAVEAGTVVRDKDNQTWIAGTEAVAAYKEGSDGLIETFDKLAETVEERLRPAVDSAVTDFEKLTESGKSTDDALEDIFKGYDLKITSDVREVIAVMEELEEQGLITTDTIKNQLGKALEKLSADELQAFAINARFAFEQGIGGAEEFARTIDQTVSAALRNLNVDIELLETGITRVGTEAIANFKLVAENIAESGDSAKLAGDKIVAAFVSAFAKVKTEAGKKDLKKALQEQLDKGTISGNQFNKAMKEIGKTTDENSLKTEALINKIRILRAEMGGAGTAGQEIGDGVQEGADNGGSALALIIGAIEGYKQKLGELSEAAVQAFDTLATGAAKPLEGIDLMQSQLQELQAEIERLREADLSRSDFSGLQGVFTNISRLAKEVEISFLEQTLAATSLFEEWDRGEVSAEQFIRNAQRMVDTSELLNDQDISDLTKGIEQATREMDRLDASANRTLTSLQNKLDRLKGDTQAVAERNYQADIAALEKQLEAAEAQGNTDAIRDLEESLRLAKEIFGIETKKIAQDKQDRAARDAERAANAAARSKDQGSTGGDDKGSNSNPGGQQVIELRVGGRFVSVSTDDKAGLLDILASAGLRTS